MTSQPPLDDLKALWQKQPADPLEMTMSEIREKAARFEKRINRRNLTEYIAAAFVVAGFSWYIAIFPNTIVRIGCGLIIAGTLFVVHRLHRKASARTLPVDATFDRCLDFYRSELVRQRDLLRSVWLWYIGPLIPGLIVFQWGVEDMLPGRPRGDWWMAIPWAVIFLLVIGLNWRAARKLGRQIDELNELGNDR